MKTDDDQIRDAFMRNRASDKRGMCSDYEMFSMGFKAARWHYEKFIREKNFAMITKGDFPAAAKESVRDDDCQPCDPSKKPWGSCYGCIRLRGMPHIKEPIPSYSHDAELEPVPQPKEEK